MCIVVVKLARYMRKRKKYTYYELMVHTELTIKFDEQIHTF